MADKPEHGPLIARIVSDSVARKATTVRLDEDLRERLREYADELGVSEAELIRQAIVFFLGWRSGQAAQARDEPPPPAA